MTDPKLEEKKKGADKAKKAGKPAADAAAKKTGKPAADAAAKKAEKPAAKKTDASKAGAEKPVAKSNVRPKKKVKTFRITKDPAVVAAKHAALVKRSKALTALKARKAAQRKKQRSYDKMRKRLNKEARTVAVNILTRLTEKAKADKIKRDRMKKQLKGTSDKTAAKKKSAVKLTPKVKAYRAMKKAVLVVEAARRKKAGAKVTGSAAFRRSEALRAMRKALFAEMLRAKVKRVTGLKRKKSIAAKKINKVKKAKELKKSIKAKKSKDQKPAAKDTKVAAKTKDVKKPKTEGSKKRGKSRGKSAMSQRGHKRRVLRDKVTKMKKTGKVSPKKILLALQEAEMKALRRNRKALISMKVKKLRAEKLKARKAAVQKVKKGKKAAPKAAKDSKKKDPKTGKDPKAAKDSKKKKVVKRSLEARITSKLTAKKVKKVKKVAKKGLSDERAVKILRANDKKLLKVRSVKGAASLVANIRRLRARRTLVMRRLNRTKRIPRKHISAKRAAWLDAIKAKKLEAWKAKKLAMIKARKEKAGKKSTKEGDKAVAKKSGKAVAKKSGKAVARKTLAKKSGKAVAKKSGKAVARKTLVKKSGKVVAKAAEGEAAPRVFRTSKLKKKEKLLKKPKEQRKWRHKTTLEKKRTKALALKKPLQPGRYRIVGRRIVRRRVGAPKKTGVRRVILRKRPAYYAAQRNKKLYPKRKPKRNTKPLRKTLTPGTVCILIAGIHKGKRVVFLKRLRSGLCLVTGPYKVNGCPMRRVNQIYLIATSAKIKLNSLNLPKTINDAYFRRRKPIAKPLGDMFAKRGKKKYVLLKKRKEDQKVVDAKVIGAIKSRADKKMMFSYLGTKFALRNRMYPHRLKF